MDTTHIISIVLTGIIAAATITYTIVTALLLLATKKSVDITQQALFLSILMREAKLVFEESAVNPNGTARHGGREAPSREALHRYRSKIMKLREEMEKHIKINFD
jgi:hypothetical protein